MITWFKSLLYDPNSAANFVRGAVFVAGELLVNAVPNSKAWYAGKAAQVLALFIKAGDKNLPPPTA